MLRAASQGCVVRGIHAEDRCREQPGTRGTAELKQAWQRDECAESFSGVRSAELSLGAVT